jgi:serine/threonine-protein phosphatase 2A regulatory subunit A
MVGEAAPTAVAGLDFDPVELLETELKAADRARRLRAVKGLSAIAVACGKEAARTRVLPVLEAHVSAGGEEDEVHLRIAEVLDSDFVTLLGGGDSSQLLLPILEALCRVEETTVRAKATKALSDVLEKCDASAAPKTCDRAVKVLTSLADPGAEAAGFGSKCSAAELCAPVLAFLARASDRDDDKAKVRKVFTTVCEDDAPLVRRAAASCLAAVCASIDDPQAFAASMTQPITKLLEDELDAVRVIAVEQLGAVLKDEDCRAGAKAWSDRIQKELDSDGEGWYATQPAARVVFAAHSDKSWRVREAVAKAFDGYCAYLSVQADRETVAPGLLDAFAALLDDGEVEVRASAFKSCVAVAELLPAPFAASESVMSSACGGADSQVEFKVRLAAAGCLARLLGALAPKHGAPQAAQDLVFNTVDARLFSDDHVEVALATLGALAAVVPFLNEEAATRVAALCETTHTHDNWRVRRALLNALPALAQLRGKQAFEDQLVSGLVDRFRDRIAEVRLSAVEILGKLRDLPEDPAQPEGPRLFDGAWLLEHVGTKLKGTYGDLDKYLHRVTVVQAFEQLSHEHLASEHVETLVSFLAEAARDPVANVRFTAVKALETCSAHAGDEAITTHVKPVLDELQQDQDDDVKFFVASASAAL